MVSPEIRGVWIPNLPHSHVLASKENIAQAMDFLQQMGFNVVCPVVWNQGFTLFRSQVMLDYGFPQIAPFFADRNFDPLEVLIQEARTRKLAVIPWFEYGFAASSLENGGHILQQNPHWSAINKAGKKVRQGGLTWMNSLDSEVQEFLLALILEVVRNYRVDGIQGDDRLPALPVEGGYNSDTQRRYKTETGRNTPPAPTDYKWIQWRADSLTHFLATLCYKVKAINPNLMVSMAPAVYPFCLNHLLQDSQAWLQKGIVDFIHPQIYRETFSKYQNEVNKINDRFMIFERGNIAPGIAFRANNTDLSVQDVLKCVQLNRQSGFQGQIFFHYERLRKNNNEMAIALQTQAGYEQRAAFPLPLSVA